MCAIVKESYPEPRYIKDENLDYQAQKTARWIGYIASKNALSAVQVKESLMENMATNLINPHTSHLRRGANAIQGLISSSKRKRNKEPITPLGLEKLNKVDSPSEEEYTEGGESESPAFNPTSPPYSVGTTESPPY